MGAMMDAVRTHWFLGSIAFAILLAWARPDVGLDGGPLHPEWTVKYIAIIVIFAVTGVGLNPKATSAAVLDVKVHCFIQAFQFLFIPVVAWGLGIILTATELVPAGLRAGFRVLSCMPPPVSSAVILTKAVRGNDAVAVFNSILGTLLGVVLTPALIHATTATGGEAHVDAQAMAAKILGTVVAPLVVGQVVRYQFWAAWSLERLPTGAIGKAMLLLVIYTTFCKTFITDLSVGIPDVFRVVVVVVAFMLALMVMADTGARLSGAIAADDRRTAVAVIYTSTHKSLTLGIPLLNILFSTRADLPLLALPLMVWHPTQLLVGSMLAPTFQRQLESQTSRTLPQ